jgi:hypothetical protein
MADKQSDMFLRAKAALRASPDATDEEILVQADIPVGFTDIVATARRDLAAGDYGGAGGRPLMR